ncbi:MAG: hypothetical protein JW801_07785 [Bacteroidales bacterium]|nr:hypothetical protein [Bacteroidales bacterium]
MNNAIQQLNGVTQQNASSSEELATSAEELAAQAEQLKEIISFFYMEDNNRGSFNESRKRAEASNSGRISGNSSARQLSTFKGDSKGDSEFTTF